MSNEIQFNVGDLILYKNTYINIVLEISKDKRKMRMYTSGTEAHIFNSADDWHSVFVVKTWLDLKSYISYTHWSSKKNI